MIAQVETTHNHVTENSDGTAKPYLKSKHEPNLAKIPKQNPVQEDDIISEKSNHSHYLKYLHIPPQDSVYAQCILQRDLVDQSL